jgi:hypothetical protein
MKFNKADAVGWSSNLRDQVLWSMWGRESNLSVQAALDGVQLFV